MLDKPNERQAEALHRLLASEDFEVVRKWLESSIQSIRERNDTVTEVDGLRKNQGALQALKEILETQDHAGEIARRYRSNR